MPFEADRIGVVAAVRGSVEIERSAKVGELVHSGAPVYLGDAVSTDEKGQLQILLLDETIFTIGPNSRLVIDEFVYDPNTDEGQVNVTIAKGVFRFITGKIAKKKPENMNVKLPVGTIGVRGTMIAGEVDGQQSMVALLGPGKNQSVHPQGSFVLNTTVGGQVVSTDVKTPGFGSEIKGPDIPPAPAFRVPDNVMNRLTGDFAAVFEGGGAAGQEDSGQAAGDTEGEPADKTDPGEPGGPAPVPPPPPSEFAGTMNAALTEAAGFQEGYVGSAQEFFETFGNLDPAQLEALCGGDCSQFSEFFIEGGQIDFITPPPPNASSFEDVRSVTSENRYFSNNLDSITTNGTLSLFNTSGQAISGGFDVQMDIQFGNFLFGGGNSKIVSVESPPIGDFEFLLDMDEPAGNQGAIDYSSTVTFPNASEFGFGKELNTYFTGIANEVAGCAGCTANAFLALENVNSATVPGAGINDIGVKMNVELTILNAQSQIVARSDTSQDILVGRAQAGGSDINGLS
jgi:hypothetical protein